MVKGTRWLVWKHVGTGTLEEILIECDKKGSLKVIPILLPPSPTKRVRDRYLQRELVSIKGHTSHIDHLNTLRSASS